MLFSTDQDWMIDAKEDWTKLTGVGMVIHESSSISTCRFRGVSSILVEALYI